MRNLKRALSLALASVMLLGMMVVGTSAASYPDVDESKNVEAIEVLNAVNVMIGRQGNFEPDELVNRHEMAVIMAKLYLGVEIADNYVGTHPFTDVVPWADKYVAACYENGLVAGTSATTFSGSKNLTAVEAAAMMLRALGYKDLNKGYQGDWRAPITAMANQIRLFNGVASNPSQQLNRNQVAQLALNTLKSPMVNLKDNTINWTDGDGQIVISGGSRDYIVLSSREAYARAINRVESEGTSASAIGGWTVELGEHLYSGKLQLRDTTDVFGRPARHWEYDGKVIGDYAKEELLVKKYNDKEGQSKVTGKDLYDLLSSDVLDDYKLIVHVDGVDDPKIVDSVKLDGNRNTSIVFDKVDLNRNNKAAVGATGTGVQTEVYVDHIEHEIYVAIINTYLAIADKDYDTKKEETPLTIYGVEQETKLGSNEYVKLQKNSEPYKLGVEEFAIAKDMAKNDSFLVTLADQEIQSIVPAEVVSGATLSAFKKGDHVVSGGTEYAYTTTATYKVGDLDQYTGDGKENLKNRTYDIYLDAYNNLIGLKEIEAKKNYVFISGLDRNGSNLVNRIATANAVFLDGTSDTIQINMTKSTWNDVVYGDQNTEGEALLNTWCTYTKSGDIYTVKEVYSAGNSANPDYTGTPNYTTDKTKGNTTGTSQFHQTGTTTGREADKDFEISLKNLRLDGGGTAANGFRYVYGDSDSVYLTAELDELRWTDGNGNIAIVTGAETVSTGIIDTSISVWNIKGAADTAEDSSVKGTIPYDAKNVAHGVYTLYDKDGTIIAVMAVGEGSAAKDLVYVHSDGLDLESDNGNSSRAAGDGLWTWSRRVIRDGQEVTLTEVGDASEELEYMLQYHWYEVRTDGNGDVIKVTEAKKALGDDGRDRFVTNYTKINDTVEETNVSTVLYQTAGGPTKVNANGSYIFDDGFGQTSKETLVVKGNNTLAVNTVEGSGIHFRNDVNVVLQYWNRNTKEIDIMAGEGVDDLKDMVSIVNDITTGTDRYNDGVKKTYYVSALIENGLATDIVIFDSYNTYSVNRPVTPTGDADLEWNKTVEEWTLWVPAGTDVSNLTTAQIQNWLLKAGCSEISKTRKGWDFLYKGMSYYEQIVNVQPRVGYAIDVTTDGNGTAYTTPTRAEKGTVVTVTATPVTGYVLNSVSAKETVSGKTVAVNTRNEFTMPDAAVTVTVTFKAEPVVSGVYTLKTLAHSKVTLNDTVLVDGAEVQAADISKLVVEPAEAVELKTDTTAKTVTVQPIKGFNWTDAWGGLWIGKDDEGNVAMIPGAVASVARFSLARAAGARVSDGQQNADTWIGDMMQDLRDNPTAKWEVKNAAGKTIWVAQKYGSGAKLVKAEGVTKADADAAFGSIETCTIWRTTEPTTPTGNRTLTLKGLLSDRDIVLDNQPVTVYAGPKGGQKVRITEWKLTNVATAAGEDISAAYTIPAGYEVEVRINSSADSGSTTNNGIINADAIYLIDKVPVVLDDTSSTAHDNITLTMTKDLTVEIKTAGAAPTKGIKVQKVTVGESVKGTWTKTGTDAIANVALTEGLNYVYDGANITFTDNGAGSKIIDSTANPFVDSVSGTTNIYDAKDTSKNTVTGVAAAKSFDSAVKVTLVGTSAVGKINGTNAVTAAGNPFYIALGKSLVLSGGSFDGYILNAKAGTPIPNNTWEVAPVGTDKDVTIYGGMEVVLGSGVTANWANHSTTPTEPKIALKNEDCAVISSSSNSYITDIKTTTGTDVGIVKKVNPEGGKVMTDSTGIVTQVEWTTANSVYALESFTQVSLYNGPANDGTTYVDAKAAGWGYYPDCRESAFYNKDGIVAAYKTNNASASDSVTFYVRTDANIYLKIDGAAVRNADGSVNTSSKAILLSVYVGDKKDETVVPDNYYVTFKATGNKDITVRPDMAPSDVQTLAESINTVVAAQVAGQIVIKGNEIHATGNLDYLGGNTEFNNLANGMYTVSGDLARFLRQLHATAGYTTAPIYYNGVEYTWGNHVVGGSQFERYDGTSYHTIIEDLVKAAGYGAAADGKSFDITVNGVTLKFVVHLDTNLKTDPTTHKQVS